MKRIALSLMLLCSLNAYATSAEELAAGIMFNTMVQAERKEKPAPATSVIAYPVPVYQPHVIVMPQCSPNFPCTAPMLTCDTLPIFDTYGRIVGYHKSCR